MGDIETSGNTLLERKSVSLNLQLNVNHMRSTVILVFFVASIVASAVLTGISLDFYNNSNESEEFKALSSIPFFQFMFYQNGQPVDLDQGAALSPSAYLTTALSSFVLGTLALCTVIALAVAISFKVHMVSPIYLSGYTALIFICALMLFAASSIVTLQPPFSVKGVYYGNDQDPSAITVTMLFVTAGTLALLLVSMLGGLFPKSGSFRTCIFHSSVVNLFLGFMIMVYALFGLECDQDLSVKDKALLFSFLVTSVVVIAANLYSWCFEVFIRQSNDRMTTKHSDRIVYFGIAPFVLLIGCLILTFVAKVSHDLETEEYVNPLLPDPNIDDCAIHHFQMISIFEFTIIPFQLSLIASAKVFSDRVRAKFGEQ